VTPGDAEREAAPAYHKVYSPAEARAYAVNKEARGPSHPAERDLVLRAFAGVPRTETVLDLPCGAGRMTVVLARAGYRVVAADVSPAMLEQARRRLDGEGLTVPLALLDLEDIGLPDRAFDTILAFRVFHHFPTAELRAAVARELCRVARRRVIVSYLDARSPTSWKRRFVSWRRGEASPRSMLRPAEAAACFTAAGFRVVADLARTPWVHSLRVLVAER